MSMTQIEAAAAEICRAFFAMPGKAEQQMAEEIITRNLFPVVRPEDVVDGWYLVKLPGHDWAYRQPWIHKDERGETIMFCTYAASECEVRGPLLMPDAKLQAGPMS